MKPVYKCDYCSYMGAEEEVAEHEPKCYSNYNMKNCYTCKHSSRLVSCGENYSFVYECKNGIEIPSGHIYNFCGSYEQKEKSDSLTSFFADMLGIEH